MEFDLHSSIRMKFRSGDAEIFYESQGTGFPVVLLHPFPVNHQFWLPLAPQLSARYRILMPDLRAHGRSEIGAGAATMDRHAEDVERLLGEESISRAVFVGVSIGGYILFEYWRRYRDRVAALVLANTRASTDTDAGRIRRLQAIDKTREQGPAGYLDEQVTDLVGATTRRNRPSLAERARALMAPMRAENIAAVQQGMIERPDSTPTLKTINVPTLIVGGDEDTVAPMRDVEVMRSQIHGSRLEVMPGAGHYAVFEYPESAAQIVRRFLDSLRLSG